MEKLEKVSERTGLDLSVNKFPDFIQQRRLFAVALNAVVGRLIDAGI
jgi:hypothetical protein